MKQAESLCWNCKRCTGRPDLPCCWAEGFIPVPGWEAKDEQPYVIINSHNDPQYDKSYTVVKCPLYIRDKPYDTFSDFMNKFIEVVGCNRAITTSRVLKRLGEFEQKTGEKVPNWIPRYIEDKIYEAKIKKKKEERRQ